MQSLTLTALLAPAAPAADDCGYLGSGNFADPARGDS